MRVVSCAAILVLFGVALAPHAGEKSDAVKLGPNASLGGKRLMPDDNPWNRDVSDDPIDPNSDNLVKSIGLDKGLHPDFGEGRDSGIPYVVVTGKQKRV